LRDAVPPLNTDGARMGEVIPFEVVEVARLDRRIDCLRCALAKSLAEQVVGECLDEGLVIDAQLKAEITAFILEKIDTVAAA